MTDHRPFRIAAALELPRVDVLRIAKALAAMRGIAGMELAQLSAMAATAETVGTALAGQAADTVRFVITPSDFSCITHALFESREPQAMPIQDAMYTQVEAQYPEFARPS